MKIRFILSTSLAVILGMHGVGMYAAGAPLTESKFIEVVGSVQVVGPSGAVRNAKAGDVFKAPDSIQTGANSRAELVAEDKTVTRVGSNTAFSFAGAGREVNLKKGSLLFHSPTGKGGGTVKSEGATAAVLGTTLAVSATTSGGFKVMTLEGKASVQQAGAPAVSLGAGQMTFATPGQPLSQPLNFSVSGTAGGSKLVNGFSQQLASMPKIEAAIARQQAELEKGGLVATGLFIGDSADKAFKVDSTVVATYVQGKQDESKRTDDKFDVAYMKAVSSALAIVDQIAAPSASVFLLDGKGRSEMGLIIPKSVGALAGRISEGQTTQLTLGESVLIAPTDGLLSVLPSVPVDHVVVASMGDLRIGVNNLVVWPKDESEGGESRRPVHFLAGSNLLFGPASSASSTTSSVDVPLTAPIRIDADLPEVGFYQLGTGLDSSTLSARSGAVSGSLKLSGVVVSNMYEPAFSTEFVGKEGSRALVPKPASVGVSSGDVTSGLGLIAEGTSLVVAGDGSATLSKDPVFSSELKARIEAMNPELGLYDAATKKHSAEVLLTVGGQSQRFRVTEDSSVIIPVGSVSSFQEGWRLKAADFGLDGAMVTKVLGASDVVGGRVYLDAPVGKSGVAMADVAGGGGSIVSAPAIEMSAAGLIASGWVALNASGDIVVRESRVANGYGITALGSGYPANQEAAVSIRSMDGSIMIDSSDLVGDTVSLNAAKALRLGGVASSVADSSIDLDNELTLLVGITSNSVGVSDRSVVNVIADTVSIYGTGFLSYNTVNVTARGVEGDVIQLDKSLIRANQTTLDGRGGNVRIGGDLEKVVKTTETITQIPIEQLEKLINVRVMPNGDDFGSKFTATAGNELSVFRTRFDVNEVNLSAKTVVVADTMFKEGSLVKFASEKGELAADPNTNRPKEYGRVNLIRNVYYGQSLILANMVGKPGDGLNRPITVDVFRSGRSK
jgi:hypothetical protein